MSFEQQSYQYTPCHPRPFYITGQSLLDMKNVRCLASHNNANCNNMLDDGRDDSWQIPLGTDPTKSWVQLELPKPVFMGRIVILKQFNGEYNFLLCMPCLHLGNQSRRVLGTCYSMSSSRQRYYIQKGHKVRKICGQFLLRQLGACHLLVCTYQSVRERNLLSEIPEDVSYQTGAFAMTVQHTFQLCRASAS